jgi:RHH-type rel operon transcriptional repressor/antitoxin RelB
MSLSIRLPKEVEERLDALARETGRSKEEYIREAVLEHLDDIEDMAIAEKRLEDLRAGRSSTHTLEKIERDLGLAD